MQTAKELRDALSSAFEDLKNGNLDRNIAGELSNIAGKIISSAKVQVEYYALRKEQPKIDFLKDDAE